MDHKEIKEDEYKKNRILVFAWVFVIIGLVVLLAFLALVFMQNIPDLNGRLNLEKLSSFGGFVGGFIGSIWSLATILFIYSTYALQRDELRELRNHNDYNRFQSDFFNLVNLNRDALKEFEYSGKSGKLAFEILVSEMVRYRDNADTEYGKRGMMQAVDYIMNLELYPMDLIYTTISVIEDQSDARTKDRYYNIFASLFTVDQKIALYHVAVYQVIEPLYIERYVKRLFDIHETTIMLSRKNGDLEFVSWA